MDDETLAIAYNAHREAERARGGTMFTRRMVIHLAGMADMRPMSLVWRLEKLGLMKRGSWEWFRNNGGITEAQIEQVRSETQETRP